MNIPVVFCFDKRIILGASVAIKSLIDCAKSDTSYDIKIFHSDLDIINQKNITKLSEGTNHRISFYYINPDLFKKAPHNKKSWTELVYYRLLIPEILKGYDKVIYADVDVLFKGDLEDVYNTDLTGYEIAAVPVELNRENQMLCHKYFPENKNDKIYISSFIIFNCKLMREEKTVDKFFKTIKTVNNRLKFFDLDVLNITCNKVYPLDFRYGTFQSVIYKDDITQAQEFGFIKSVYSIEELEKAKADTIMIHYAGKMGKPWRMKNPYPDYKEYIDKLPKELVKYTFRDLRKRFFNRR